MSAHQLRAGDHSGEQHGGLARGQGASPCPGTGLLPANPTCAGPRCPVLGLPLGCPGSCGPGERWHGAAGDGDKGAGGEVGRKQEGVYGSMAGVGEQGQRGS